MRSRIRGRLKRLLLWSGVIALIIVIVTGAAGAWVFDRAQQSNVGTVAFTNRLAIPPLLEPTIDDQDRKVFDLEFIAGQAELIPGKQTDT